MQLKRLGIIRIISLFLVTFAVAAAARADQGELVISRMDNAVSSQITSFVLGRIYERIDQPVRFQGFPNKEALMVAARGEVDGTNMRIAGLQKKHPDLVLVPTPFVILKFRVFTQRDLPDFATLKDLQDQRIGIVNGVIVAERLTQDMKPVKYKDVRSLYLALMVDNVDIAVATDLIGGLELIRNFSGSPIRAVGPPLRVVELHHYLHRRNEELVARLDTEIASLRKTGELDRLYGEAFKHIKNSDGS